MDNRAPEKEGKTGLGVWELTECRVGSDLQPLPGGGQTLQ